MSANPAVITRLRGSDAFPLTDDEDPARPYRLWDARTQSHVRWRCYSSLYNAHMGAIAEASWAREDTVIEVIHAHKGTLYGQYKRTGGNVNFWRSTHKIEPDSMGAAIAERQHERVLQAVRQAKEAIAKAKKR